MHWIIQNIQQNELTIKHARATLALKNAKCWYWISDTYISSVALAVFDPLTLGADIITGGFYWDGSRGHAQLCDWSGSTTFKNVNYWTWGSGTTTINSITTCEAHGDSGNEIATGGIYGYGEYTGSTNAQLCVWEPGGSIL